eukprot:10703692-Lingulodinium_polyedra.AAC.1
MPQSTIDGANSKLRRLLTENTEALILPATKIWDALTPFRIRNAFNGRIDPWHHGGPCGYEADPLAYVWDAHFKEVVS